MLQRGPAAVHHFLQAKLGFRRGVRHLKTENNLLVPRLNRLLARGKKRTMVSFVSMNTISEAWILFFPFRNNDTDSFITCLGCLLEIALVFICRWKGCEIL